VLLGSPNRCTQEHQIFDPEQKLESVAQQRENPFVSDRGPGVEKKKEIHGEHKGLMMAPNAADEAALPTTEPAQSTGQRYFDHSNPISARSPKLVKRGAAR